MTTQPNTCECPYCHQKMATSGAAILDTARFIVERNGARVKLTHQLFDMFSVLHKRLGRVVRKGVIYDEMFSLRPDCDQPEPKIVDVQISKLRQKLPPLGLEIKTIWGHGYEMRICAATQESKAA